MITVSFIAILIAFGFYATCFIKISASIDKSNRAATTVGSYTIHLQADPSAKNLTTVYLRNNHTGQETKFISLTDVYAEHYHAAEFVNGALYIIRRTGGSEGFMTNPNWTDELWRYESNGTGRKLYSVRGIDFRVSADTGTISIVANSYPHESIILLNPDGDVLDAFSRSDVGVADHDYTLNPLFWRNGIFWLTAREGMHLMELISIDSRSYAIGRIDVAFLSVSGNEFAFDPHAKMIAFSTYVSPLDIQDVHNPPHQIVSLYLYNVNTGVKKKLLTASVTRELLPQWLDTSTIEYNDPHSQGRVSIKVSY